MDQGIIQVNHTGTTKDASMIEPHFELPTTLEIEYQRVLNVQPRGNHIPSVVVIQPAHFPYTSTNAVPWHYNATAFVNAQKINMESILVISVRPYVSNIARASRMTHSGRIFAPTPP